MKKKNFIRVTLLVSALAFNPLVAQQRNVNSSTQLEQVSVTTSIASILHKRGLDEDAALNISKNLVNEEDELFAMMIDNLINSCDSVDKDEILEYLSRAALHKQEVQFDSYAQLVHMVSNIKQKALDENTLAQLSMVAKQNTAIFS